MRRALIKELKSSIGKTVRVCGWVEIIRDQKKMQFIVVRDQSGSVQIVHEKHVDENLAMVISDLTHESVVDIIGEVVFNPKAKLGGLEVLLRSLSVVSKANSNLPLESNSISEVRSNWRFLDLRTKSNSLIFIIQTTLERAMRTFWENEGYVELHSPKLIAAASESGAEVFEVKYFDKKAYLAQSPQFYKQMMIAAGFEKVFEIGPVFRAEPSYTTRHATEFIGVDIEISWIESHEDLMKLEELWLCCILKEIQSKHGSDIEEYFGVKIIVPELPFPRVSVAKAYEILSKIGHIIDREKKGDLDPEGERLLSKYFLDKYGHEFVFVTDYPVTARPFYHMRHKNDSFSTKSFDLLWKGIEITTGAQREHRYDILLSQAEEKGIQYKSLQFYFDFFKFGCPPHGGYGLGLARMMMVMLNLKSIREAMYIYRGVNRLVP